MLGSLYTNIADTRDSREMRATSPFSSHNPAQLGDPNTSVVADVKSSAKDLVNVL